MDRSGLIDTLGAFIPVKLTEELVDEFLAIRRDVATSTLGRSAAGKFLETVVQALQYLESGKYSERPAVDQYLKNLEERSSTLPEGFRLCASRIARAAYTLRNKRNIAHKGAVDPNTYDLRFTHAAAQWILAEFLRVATSDSMEKAGRLIDQVMAPVGSLVEEFGGKSLVLDDLPAREEMLLLLHHVYPNAVHRSALVASMDRRDESTVRKTLRALWGERLVENIGDQAYKLTQRGVTTAITAATDLMLGAPSTA